MWHTEVNQCEPEKAEQVPLLSVDRTAGLRYNDYRLGAAPIEKNGRPAPQRG